MRRPNLETSQRIRGGKIDILPNSIEQRQEFNLAAA
jgi:hypothetical protein